MFHRGNPLVSVGWKGNLFRYELIIRNIVPISFDLIHVASAAWCMFEAAGFVVVTSVPQIAMADLDAEGVPIPSSQRGNDESVFVHQDKASAHKSGALSNTPQGIPHGANEAAREAFQKWRIPARDVPGVASVAMPIGGWRCRQYMTG